MRLNLFSITILNLIFLVGCQKESSQNDSKEDQKTVTPCTVDMIDDVDKMEESLFFDSLGRLINLIKIQNGRKEEIEFSYDEKGRLIQIYDKEGTEYEVYEYDDFGKIVKELIYDDSITLENLKEYEIHEFNEKNQKVKTTYFQVGSDSKAQEVEIDFYTYNEKGDLIEINTELLREKKKFKEAVFEYSNIESKIKYPVGYAFYSGNFLPSRKIVYSNSGAKLHEYLLYYETNSSGFPTKSYVINNKFDSAGKPESSDTISVLNYDYKDCF
ncbi:MAG: RHS repeat domain-containing protein [Cytophagales bacterium]